MLGHCTNLLPVLPLTIAQLQIQHHSHTFSQIPREVSADVRQPLHIQISDGARDRAGGSTPGSICRGPTSGHYHFRQAVTLFAFPTPSGILEVVQQLVLQQLAVLAEYVLDFLFPAMFSQHVARQISRQYAL